MKKKVMIGSISAVLLLAVGILLFVLLGGEKSYRNIQVQETLGTTTVVRNEQDSLEAYKGMKLADGDDVEVMPESSLIMKLDEDKYVYAEADTKFQIKAAGSENSGKTVIVLEEGSVLVEIQEKLSEEESFEVETINSAMAVRGTVFQVMSYKNEAGESVTAVAVFEGAVETAPSVGEAVSIVAGQMAQLTGEEIEVQEIDLEEVSDEVLEWLMEMETADLAFEQNELEQHLGATEPTEVPTPVPEPTEEPTPVPTATNTPVPTATNTPVPAATSTPVPAATSTPVPTATSTPVPTATSTPVPTATSTPVPTATSTPVPTATSTPVPTATSTPVPTKVPVVTGDGLTGLDAFEITSQMIIGWNLGNALDSHGSYISSDAAPSKFVTAWGNEEPTKELFEAVKAAGFNTIRIPTTWYQHIKYDSRKNQYSIDKEWLAYVKKVVDYAYELDLFVILNAHHEDWANVPQFTDATYEKASEILTALWSKVAETFADYDQHLIFEAMNEPRQTGLGGDVEWGGGDANSWAYINKLNQVFVNAVRGQGSVANKERLLILPGYGASSNIATVKSIEVPKNGGNIALSVHAYFPYFFAMDTGSYANHSFPGKSGYGENYEESINTLFRDLKAVSKEKNAPIVIGEFGASDFNNTADRARWATHFLTKAKDAGIPCVFWDNQATYNGTGEAYGLISRTTYTWFENSIPMVQAAMKVYGQKNDLPEYVEQVFDWSKIPVEANWVQIYRSEYGQYIGTWGNQWLENWKPYLSKDYDIVLVYDSDSEPYMVLQGGWHKVFASKPSGNPYMLRFTFADVQATMKAENGRLEDMYNYFASASDKDMILYGVYAVPVK